MSKINAKRFVMKKAQIRKIKKIKEVLKMKLTDIIKNEKLLCFAGGVLAATYGVKALKSEKARKTAVNGLAKCMKLQKDAQATFQNMRDEAEDICYDAKQKADE